MTYTLTGLDAGGDAFVEHFLSRANYAAMLVDWQRALVAALASGKPAPARRPHEN